MRILTISDVIVDIIHSPVLLKRFGDVDCVLGCGDLKYDYMEYIVSMLNKPLYYVFGNHAQPVMLTSHGKELREPQGCTNIHRKVIERNGVLIGGIEGAMLYNHGPHQYTEFEQTRNAMAMVPKLLWNQQVHGRAIDILITHAPPRGIHDGQDLCHLGFSTYLKFMDRFKPRYLIHGHTHLYRLDAVRETQYGETTVLNTYGYQVIEIDETKLGRRAK